MYLLDDLLRMAHVEETDGLSLKLGKPPVMRWRDKYPKLAGGKVAAVEGPAITVEDCEHFLLGLTNSRQRRDIRERGGATFFFLWQGRILFLVRAEVTDEVVGFEIQ